MTRLSGRSSQLSGEGKGEGDRRASSNLLRAESCELRAALYRADLAFIHDAGFSEFAQSAAPGLLAMFEKAGVREGMVVDAGCGSGVLSRILLDSGFRVFAFDASPDMVALARGRAPEAELVVARSSEVSLPPCDAIVAMGEVLNYGTFDELRAFVAHARSALRSGGVLVFDIAERESYPAHDEVRVGGGDWSVIAVKESDGVHLTRRVLTFRYIHGEVRRDEEVHTLELYDRAAVVALLREHGFRVRVRRSYGTRRLPVGHGVYVAVAR